MSRPRLAGADAEALTAEMLAALGHRGPEGAASVRVGESVIGHAMLAFVLPRSSQPVVSADGRVALAFDGQIYNYREIGRSLSLPPDTPEGRVVLEAYMRDGLDVLPRLRGMFGLVVVDARDGSLVLARDPLGRKPLYYLWTGEEVAFASELKALKLHPAFTDDIDATAVARFLAFNAVPAPLSIFRCIKKLRAGTYLRFADGAATETVYWSLPRAGSDLDIDEKEALPRLRQVLGEAVDRRVQGIDAPLGLALSGGIDSAIVAALVAERGGASAYPAFTVGFEDRSFDESSAATRIAAHLGLEHHIIRADGAAIERAVTEFYPTIDEPLADPSMIPMLLLCERASQSVKGLLGGDGADEFHFGYLSFQASQALAWIERLVPDAVLRPLVRGLGALPPGRRNFDPRMVLRMMARALHSRPELRFYNATAMMPLDELQERPWSKELAPHMAPIELTTELESFVDQNLPEVDRVQRAIVCHFLRDVIIAKIDRAGMMWSIETRCPYLDVDLVEWSLRLPRHLHLRFGEGKRLLRALGAELLPPDIAKRRKQGFRPPLAHLLRHELRELLLDLLSARNVTRIGVFDTRLVVRMVDEHLREVADHHRALWSLVCFHLWHRHHIPRRPGLRRPALAVG